MMPSHGTLILEILNFVTVEILGGKLKGQIIINLQRPLERSLKPFCSMVRMEFQVCFVEK